MVRYHFLELGQGIQEALLCDCFSNGYAIKFGKVRSYEKQQFNDSMLILCQG